jgi:hypothetical protein
MIRLNLINLSLSEGGPSLFEEIYTKAIQVDKY